MDFDLIIKNATIVTASEVLPPGLSIGIKDGNITTISSLDLPGSPSTQIIDAEGAYVTPGGIDSHVHLHQDNAPTGDKWASGSLSALCGGNTTIIAFATQKRTDDSLIPVVEEYHRRASGQSYIDYGFHLILANPTPKILEEELPLMVDQGITSCKLYMTYPAFKLTDLSMLEIMMRTRSLGMTTMIHAENSDMIDLVTQRLLQNNKTTPQYHALARPQLAESEATHRAISLSTLTSTPILIVHMSAPSSLAHARKAQSKHLLPVHAETCPHYLHLTSDRLAATHNIHQTPDGHTHEEPDAWAGAKHICAPPLRHTQADLQSVWDAVANGTITVVSSDHAPTRYADVAGKRKPLADAAARSDGTRPTFAGTPNGLPGIETRLPLLFHAATSPTVPGPRRISLPRFVALTSTNAARLYGLAATKGAIAPGLHADLVVWYPTRHPRAHTTITNTNLHHAIDYTPFEGHEVCNWPRYVVCRGRVRYSRDAEIEAGIGTGVKGAKGEGNFLRRGAGEVLVGRAGVTPAGMREGERREWGLDA